MNQADYLTFEQALQNPSIHVAMNEWLEAKLASQNDGLMVVNKHLVDLNEKLEARNQELEKINHGLNAEIRLILVDARPCLYDRVSKCASRRDSVCMTE